MALGLQVLVPETMGGRIAGVLLAVLVLVATLYLANRWYSASFFNGFLVAVGIFLSFDLFLVHWMMKLHRVTSGDEAIWLEVSLFVAGLIFIVIGVRRERQVGALEHTHTRRTTVDLAVCGTASSPGTSWSRSTPTRAATAGGYRTCREPREPCEPSDNRRSWVIVR